MELKIASKKFFSELNPTAVPVQPLAAVVTMPNVVQTSLRQMRRIAETGNIIGFQRGFQQFQNIAAKHGVDLEQDLETRVALMQMQLTLLMSAAKRALANEKLNQQQATAAEVLEDEGAAAAHAEKAKHFGEMAQNLLAEIKAKLG